MDFSSLVCHSQSRYWRLNSKFVNTRQKGFTLIELVLVVAIVSLLGLLTLPFFSRFFNQNAVSNAVDQLTGELRKAQVYSMVGKQNGPWGVSYNSNTITLFQGNTYATRNTGLDEKFNVNPAITISGITEVDFSRLTGTPSATPVIVISGTGTSKTITLNSLGIVNK